ncbi:MAG: S41 family peptidase [bacterium]|nr:S41 family peptidase [bacterium]
MTTRSLLTRPAPALGLLLAGALLTARPASAQDLERVLRTQLGAADGAPVEQLFEVGNQLLDEAPESDDAFRNALVTAVEGTGEKARLAAAVALKGLKEDATYGRDLLALLEPLSGSEDEGIRAMAIALCGDRAAFNTRVLPDVRELVEKNCKDELVPPLVRIEASLALWGIGSNGQRAVAKTTLEQFLRSSDRDLVVRGALALAQMNVESGKAWSVLREIKDEPTTYGRQARLFLQRAEMRREFDRDLARLAEKLHGQPDGGGDTDYRLLDELRSRIRFTHVRGGDLSDQELLEFAAKGMLQGLDRHSTFFTGDEYKKFFFDLDREYGGIGAFVNFDQDDDFSIVRPIYSGPAYRAGLRSGDKILEVDGWETSGHTSDEIIRRLKGRPGTDVVLKVYRLGFQEPQMFSIQRGQISVPSVNWAMLPGDIGYIELITFSANISREIQVALDDLMDRGAKGLVLDVRNNTGGYLTKAVDVVEKFLPAETLVLATEGPSEKRREYVTRPRRFVTDLPLAVLTNNFSASASEITAGALQDHGRAVIVGERTFGKGSVQNIIPLETDQGERFSDLNRDGAWQDGEPFDDRNGNGKFDAGARIKITVALYYLPSGRTPHRQFDKEGRVIDPNWGVIPDKKLDLLEKNPADAWKNSAVFALLKEGAFRKYVKDHLGKNEALFRKLAEGDDGDPQKYPDFDAFYDSLDTKLSKDDVRRWIRYEVRDQVSDLRGAVYPGNRALGDPQEDAQLQEAVRSLLDKVGVDIRAIDAYRNVLKIDFGDKEKAAKK